MNFNNILTNTLQNLRTITLVKKNVMLYSIILFLMMYVIIILLKPNIVFDEHGNLRTFGIGFQKKTILPAWLVAIVLAILSYLVISIYVFD
jgi:hypothetical protein